MLHTDMNIFIYVCGKNRIRTQQNLHTDVKLITYGCRIAPYIRAGFEIAFTLLSGQIREID